MTTPIGTAEREACDRPRPIATQLYDDASYAVWERLQPCCPQATVYRFGTVTVPGVSDLDLVVVFPDGAEVPMATLRVGAWAPEQRGVFCHGPLVFSHSDFHDFPLIYPNAQLERVGGPDIPLRPLTAAQRKLLGLIMGVEFLPLRWSDYGACLLRRRIAVRHALVQLASLKHTVSHLAEWDLRQDNWTAFVDHVAGLRRRMVESCNMPELVAALQQAEPIVRELMVAHDRLLDGLVGGTPARDAQHATALLTGKRRVTLFTRAVEDPGLPAEHLLLTWKRATWRGASVYLQPVLSLAHAGSLRHIEALLAGEPPYAAALCRRLLTRRASSPGAGYDQSYVELAQQRAMLGWRRTSLRAMPGHGPLLTGLGGPFWSDVQQTVPYRGSLRQRLTAGAGGLLSVYQRHLMRAGARRLLRLLADVNPPGGDR